MHTIEMATVADVPAMVELLHILFTQELEFTPAPERQRRGLELILGAPHAGRIFVARRADELDGMLNLLFTVSTALGQRVCWIDDMIVKPGARSTGVGSCLIEHAIGFATAEGFGRIQLQTDAINSGAQRFYERHGFSRSTMQPMRLLLPRPAASN